MSEFFIGRECFGEVAGGSMFLSGGLIVLFHDMEKCCNSFFSPGGDLSGAFRSGGATNGCDVHC